MDQTPIYKKDEKLFCKCCGDHILTFAVDCFPHTRQTEAIIKQDEGQGPWVDGDIMKCRKCGKNYYL